LDARLRALGVGFSMASTTANGLLDVSANAGAGGSVDAVRLVVGGDTVDNGPASSDGNGSVGIL
jgi:hypothetical protein